MLIEEGLCIQIKANASRIMEVSHLHKNICCFAYQIHLLLQCSLFHIIFRWTTSTSVTRTGTRSEFCTPVVAYLGCVIHGVTKPVEIADVFWKVWPRTLITYNLYVTSICKSIASIKIIVSAFPHFFQLWRIGFLAFTLKERPDLMHEYEVVAWTMCIRAIIDCTKRI